MADLTSRKFILTCALMVGSFVFVLMGMLPAKEWMEMAIVAAGIYSTANIVDAKLK